MELKTHPVLPDLQCNVDGTHIVWKGNLLQPNKYQRKRDNYPFYLLCFNGKSHRLTKVICECWHGMRDDKSFTVKRRDFNPENNHYTNLYWGKKGGTRTKKTKRAKTSKIKNSDIQDIINRIEKGDSLAKIAKFYHTSDMSIYRVKENYITNKKSILKRAIMFAKDNYDKRLAFANYFGYKSIKEAVKQLGYKTFIYQCQQVTL